MYALRKLLRRLDKDVSGFKKAVVTTVAKFFDIETSNAGIVFDIICGFSLGRNREINCLPNLLVARSAIKFIAHIAVADPFDNRNTLGSVFFSSPKKHVT